MSSYKLIEELGRGGMGVVYKALHPALGREVAIKFLQGATEEITDVSKSRFRREMEVLMRLSHPSIVKVYDAGLADGRLYYVMELLAAKDLLWHQRRRGKLPSEVVLGLLDQLLDALEYLHTNKLVHRDIKPSNVVLEDSGRAILMDFGVVRLEGATVLTQQGHAVGTPKYFAPEMIQRGESGPASDQWSLGVVAYELFSGASAFDGESLPQLAYAILKNDPVPLAQAAPDIPAAVAPIIMRMIEKDPAKRWPSCGEARTALQAAMNQWEQAPDTLLETSLVPLPPAPAPSRPTGKRAVASVQRSTVKGRSITGDSAPDSWSSRSLSALSALEGRARYVIALAAVFGILLGYPFARMFAPGKRAEAITAPSREQIAIKRTKSDEITIKFPTRTPSQWAIDRGKGPESAEATPTTSHVLTLKTSPWDPELALAVVCGPYRVDVEPPPALPGLVARLLNATREPEFSPETLDNNVWKRLRGVLGRHTKRRDAKGFREALTRAPAARTVLDEHVAKLRRLRNLGETLENLEHSVALVLTSSDAQTRTRMDLLRALWALDRWDALASWLALPPPFGVQAMMRPALQIESDLTEAKPAAAAAASPLPLAPDPRGFVIVMHTELPTGQSNTFLTANDTMFIMRDLTARRGWGPRASFRTSSAAPHGRRFHFLVSTVGPHYYLKVLPPGFDTPLPVRPPQGSTPPGTDPFWLSVTLRGELGGPSGEWELRQSRAFEEINKVYIVVDRVLAEDLAAP
jgi:serine/threonine protein kinase